MSADKYWLPTRNDGGDANVIDDIPLADDTTAVSEISCGLIREWLLRLSIHLKEE